MSQLWNHFKQVNLDPTYAEVIFGKAIPDYGLAICDDCKVPVVYTTRHLEELRLHLYLEHNLEVEMTASVVYNHFTRTKSEVICYQCGHRKQHSMHISFYKWAVAHMIFEHGFLIADFPLFQVVST